MHGAVLIGNREVCLRQGLRFTVPHLLGPFLYPKLSTEELTA